MRRTDASTSFPAALVDSSKTNKRLRKELLMIRKLPSGKYRLYSGKKDPRTGKRRNLGTFPTRHGAEKHERAVQYFKRH
jgi:hypothetical protein